MSHNCNQIDRFNSLDKQISKIKDDFSDHRKTQEEYEKERIEYREVRKIHDKELAKKLSTIELALFGNKELGIVGDHEMIKEMHAVMIGSSIIKKTLIWVFSTTMAIGGAIVLWFELAKNIREK